MMWGKSSSPMFLSRPWGMRDTAVGSMRTMLARGIEISSSWAVASVTVSMVSWRMMPVSGRPSRVTMVWVSKLLTMVELG